MKILKIIGIVIVAIILVLVIWASMLPSTSHIERTTVIKAPVSNVYASVVNFKEFNKWSPWFQIDPDGTTYTYEGPESGIGAKMSWTSEHPEVGSGSQEIVDLEEFKMVKNVMDFGMDGNYYATYFLKENEDGIELTWAYDAEDLGLISRAFVSMMDIETMLGDTYDKGLASLKILLEDQVSKQLEMEQESMESDSTMVESDSTVVEEL